MEAPGIEALPLRVQRQRIRKESRVQVVDHRHPFWGYEGLVAGFTDSYVVVAFGNGNDSCRELRASQLRLVQPPKSRMRFW